MRHLRKILVFRSGLLGDTLVAIPALRALRQALPGAKISYVWQSTELATNVTPPQVLHGAMLVDDFYRLPNSISYVETITDYARLWRYVKKAGFDAAIVLEARHWSRTRERFLRLAGVPLVVGPDGRQSKVFRDSNGALPRVDHIADELISLVARLGIETPSHWHGDPSLPRTSAEKRAVDEWMRERDIPADCILLAVAPGSNMPAKRWPVDRFADTIRPLLDTARVVPVILGASGDRLLASELVQQCGCGFVAAGDFGVREGIELLSRCALFLGNDTGTMHMAVAAGIPCVAVFAAVDMPGRWEPYGEGHVVFRSTVECAGCLLRECTVEGMRCLLGIQPAAVIRACERALRETLVGVA